MDDRKRREAGILVHTCSAALLVVVLYGLADGVMDDESDVMLVDAHPERHCGDDHLQQHRHRHGPTWRLTSSSTFTCSFQGLQWINSLHLHPF